MLPAPTPPLLERSSDVTSMQRNQRHCQRQGRSLSITRPLSPHPCSGHSLAPILPPVPLTITTPSKP
ncbi:hypothetical protein ACOMHN_053403 [Nucella lapillus]